jgi:hypothetical protein
MHSIEDVDPERKHLEKLYQERINFYIVFASVFVVGLSEMKEGGVKVASLWAMTLVSTAIMLSVIRTFRLVRKALADIKKHVHHPYTEYQSKIKFPWDANISLVSVPIILTVFFWCVTLHYSCPYLQRIASHLALSK